MKDNILAASKKALGKFKNLTKEGWDSLFASIKKEEDRYLSILNFQGDVSQNQEFQRWFNGFYQIRRNMRWRRPFYNYFQELRTSTERNLRIDSILERIHRDTGRWEYSFSTKMLHTLDATKPIIDSKVMALLGISFHGQREISNFVPHYSQYEAIANTLLSTKTVQEKLAEFDRKLPRLKNIPKLKKLDFIMWKFESK